MQVFHRLPDGLHELKGGFRGGAHKDGHEFFPAVPGKEVGGALEIGGDGLGHGGNHLVPGGVSEGVVVQLELVDIEHTDGEGQVKPDRLVPAGRAAVLVPPPVGHAGELVDHGLLPELHLIMVELDMGIHPGLDDHRVEGLGHIVHRPQQQPLLLKLDIGEAGEQDHRDVPGQVGGLQFPQEGEAVHFRHDDIQKDQGKVPLLGGAEPLLRRVAGGQLVLAPEDGA